ncbi:3-phosphoshikimate 1-carboxyvinyltransferase [Macrococcoides caseolyticum]|uniref:3-phosphoshikimate 1-carboxyvinyltransferase n=1 Tax=Macrococcoides caseolyticum TaxID=69966 RepID=A0ACC9MTV0_9STAP|nr:3-phosphoshikimate 1-carboxyvinyltransferase [Macrococcus caseolyticus]ARQ04592.1 3-phosphoshikimate 1-carboxyvinyltransferase [Macrococcus caseolyticus]PKE07455.1 3-phosphoshikimate 1-carboxyvinyltransferase [Macrococcus caseolyticus]PKE24451.1 3-phosphoshikimate 1-carboxyvinyltransferase [Macrococcus caseolyticus]PKE40015.1 3-phosphoshikimate 1-carboxyvinyltransferase [Macrococcus caseolyticus]PKE53706.1 3-phosphoshikimate 1-carboxyvinyltransferase [Macrococcus caseolyticus]
MKLKYNGPLTGEVSVPGDKSITHRAIMLASLSKGKTVISKPLLGEDCVSTINIFRKLGVQISTEEDNVIVDSPGYEQFREPAEVLYTGNSGTTTRLLCGLLAGLPFKTVLDGDASIGQRPMGRVIEPLREMGVNIKGRDNQFTPIIINDGGISKVQGINYMMPVKSAQVKSAILLAGLYAEDEVRITEQDISRNHTELMFKNSNIDIEVNDRTILLKSNGIHAIKMKDIEIPGDISSAAFFIVAALIIPGSKITLQDVGTNVTRSGILEVVKMMGGNIQVIDKVQQTEPVSDIVVSYTHNLTGITIEGSLIPKLIDEIPVIALLLAHAQGKSEIRDAEELKVKETNRIDTVVSELNALGYKIQPTTDGMVVYGKVKDERTRDTFDSYGDHRIGMMLAVAALLETVEIEINQFEAINISYPSFMEHINQLKGEL